MKEKNCKYFDDQFLPDEDFCWNSEWEINQEEDCRTCQDYEESDSDNKGYNNFICDEAELVPDEVWEELEKE